MPVLIPFVETDLPFSIIHEYRIGTKSRVLYLTAIVSVVIALASLAFMSIPTTLRTKGVINSKHSKPLQGALGKSSTGQVGSYDPANNLLIANCHVSPSDIDLIKIGQEVSFPVHGFDNETWGVLCGRVVGISNDVILGFKDGPVFEVYCSLSKVHLQSNGAKAILKKGMALTAEFDIGPRRLLESRKDIETSYLSNH